MLRFLKSKTTDLLTELLNRSMKFGQKFKLISLELVVIVLMLAVLLSVGIPAIKVGVANNWFSLFVAQ